MTIDIQKNQLITNQQIEIEALKQTIKEQRSAMTEAYSHALYVQQWSKKCDEFPRVSMNCAIRVASLLEDHI